jgi:hypothetical protein
MEESGRGIILSITRHFPRGKPRKTSVRIAGLRPESVFHFKETPSYIQSLHGCLFLEWKQKISRV